MNNNLAENLCLTEKEIERERAILREDLLPVSDPDKSIPYEKAFAEV
ncbi:MAG: hypothetical protein FWE86_01395 [Oscillospiraceae bacterium]|nr:hypothetical protein [Oscillospiraceae bacterium]